MKEFKPILFFLLRFIVCYIILLFVYNQYLNYYNKEQKADWYTHKVADGTAYIMNFFNETHAVHDKASPYVWIHYKDSYISYVNEGCNAVSIIIIFVSIVFGFYTKLIPTLTFAFLGSISIIIFNLLRVVGINLIIYYFPEYSKIAHDYLFPVVIYGYIIILWIVWIRIAVIKK